MTRRAAERARNVLPLASLKTTFRKLSGTPLHNSPTT
jgi:hypothetical protein